MKAADRDHRTDELIGASEALRNELIAEVEKLESFVAALQHAVDERVAERREQDAGDH